MRIAKDDQVCGVPAPAARKLMRAFRRGELSTDDVAYVLEVDGPAASGVLTALAAEDFVRPSGMPHLPEDGHWWAVTTRGNALAQASFGKPITRVTAERLLAGAIERAGVYNRDARHLLAVAELFVFGSFLDPEASTLGDLDLAVSMVFRETDGHRCTERTLAYARASGRSFPDFVDQLYWPQTELIRILKNRSTAINITTEDLTALTDTFRCVYRVGDDPGAIQPPPGAPVQR